jgi:hypothetical protein
LAVVAIFKYEVGPGRMNDFMGKLAQTASPRFNSPVMPKGIRLFRNTVPGPDTGPVYLLIEYENMTNTRIWPRTGLARPGRTPIRSGLTCSPRGLNHQSACFRFNCSPSFEAVVRKPAGGDD